MATIRPVAWMSASSDCIAHKRWCVVVASASILESNGLDKFFFFLFSGFSLVLFFHNQTRKCLGGANNSRLPSMMIHSMHVAQQNVSYI